MRLGSIWRLGVLVVTLTLSSGCIINDETVFRGTLERIDGDRVDREVRLTCGDGSTGGNPARWVIQLPESGGLAIVLPYECPPKESMPLVQQIDDAKVTLIRAAQMNDRNAAVERELTGRVVMYWKGDDYLYHPHRVDIDVGDADSRIIGQFTAENTVTVVPLTQWPMTTLQVAAVIIDYPLRLLKRD